MWSFVCSESCCTRVSGLRSPLCLRGLRGLAADTPWLGWAGLGHNIEYPGWWRADTLCFIVTRWHSYKCSRVSHDRKLHVWTDPVPQCATISTQYLHNIYTLPWYLLSISRYTDWCVWWPEQQFHLGWAHILVRTLNNVYMFNCVSGAGGCWWRCGLHPALLTVFYTHIND